MPDWLEGLKSARDTLANAASGARYIVAPNASEASGDAEQGISTLDKVNDWAWGSPAQQQRRNAATAQSFQNLKSGDASLNDVFDPTMGRARAQVAQQTAIAEGPKIGPRPGFMQVRDALEEIRPLPLIGSLADMLGGDTDITAARDPNNRDDWADVPTPQAGMTRIGVGEDALTRRALRESLNGLNAARAKQVLSPAAAEAWESFATAYPRISAHMSPVAWADEAATQAATNAGVANRIVQGGYAHLPQGAKIGGVAINPKLTTPQALDTLRHEGTHAARAIRRADRGFNWKQEYDDVLAKVGYDAHPEEHIADAAMKTAATRADTIATRDAMRQFEKLAGVR